MGKKNPREEAAEIKAPKNDISSAPSIFQSLFGDISEHGPSTSIFSARNPFRRNPSDRAAQIPSSGEAPAGTGDGGSDNPPVAVDTRRRKRKGDEKAAVEWDSAGEKSEIGLVSKKLKKKEKSPAFGFQASRASVKDGETLNLEGLKIEEEGKKKKKKRKRDEIEMEYEGRHYGPAPPEKEEGEGRLGGTVVGEKRKAVDNAAELLVPNEGFDDESKLLRTVFVGNLPLKVKKKALLKEFSQFGEIESLRIRSVPIVDSKVPRKGAIMKNKINESVDSVHAYIVFKTEESAQASLAHNMSLIGGNHMRVDRACPPRKKLKGEGAPLYDNKRTVFLGNIPFDVKDEEIYQLFSRISQLESSLEAVRVIRDPHTSVGKGIAYVLFKTREAANLAVKKRYLKLRDRELRLSHARSDATPSKRKNLSPSESMENFPAKKLALDSSTPKDGYERRKMKADVSYQGLRGNKSGTEEKLHRKTVKTVRAKSMTPRVEKPKDRKHKRPSVAGRKAKQLALKNAGASKVAGQKRKDGRTPDSSHRKKKAKMSR